MPPEILLPVQYRTLPNIKRIRHIYIKTTYLSVPDDSDAAAPVLVAPLGVPSPIQVITMTYHIKLPIQHAGVSCHEREYHVESVIGGAHGGIIGYRQRLSSRREVREVVRGQRGPGGDAHARVASPRVPPRGVIRRPMSSSASKDSSPWSSPRYSTRCW